LPDWARRGDDAWAIYDAVNSIIPTHEPYLVKVPASPTASIDAAVAYAAHDTLAVAFSSTTVDLAAELAKALSMLPPGTSTTEIAAGKTVGRAAARAMITARSGDGADDNTPYATGMQPGDWRPTGSGAALSPNWPKVKPFCIDSGSQFRPPRPGGYLSKAQMLRSEEYAAQFNDVKELGRFDSASRTAEQTQIAFFWANDLDGTYKPPGQLLEITKIVSEQKGLDVVEKARLFALVSLAMGDAAIVAWDAKYSTDLDLWRPETAIQMGDMDGNGATKVDPKWKPLSIDRSGNRFSPPFPAYVSGHATFGAAHAAIMRRYFGTDNVAFTATTEDPNAKDANGNRVTRTFGTDRIQRGRHTPHRHGGRREPDHGFSG
jgi:hypothetical protein